MESKLNQRISDCPCIIRVCVQVSVVSRLQ